MEINKVLTECVFKNVLAICRNGKMYGRKELSDIQKNTIVRSSKLRNDGFHCKIFDFEHWKFHIDCYSEYTSKEKIAWVQAMKRKEEIGESPSSSKRLRRYVDIKILCFFETNINHIILALHYQAAVSH